MGRGEGVGSLLLKVECGRAATLCVGLGNSCEGAVRDHKHESIPTL